MQPYLLHIAITAYIIPGTPNMQKSNILHETPVELHYTHRNTANTAGTVTIKGSSVTTDVTIPAGTLSETRTGIIKIGGNHFLLYDDKNRNIFKNEKIDSNTKKYSSSDGTEQSKRRNGYHKGKRWKLKVWNKNDKKNSREHQVGAWILGFAKLCIWAPIVFVGDRERCSKVKEPWNKIQFHGMYIHIH